MIIDYLTLFQNDFKVFIPELYLVIVFSFLLIYGVIYSPSIYYGSNILIREISWLVIFSLSLTLLLTISNPFTDWILFNNLLVVDDFSSSFKILILSTAIMSIIMSLGYIKNEKINSFEYTILILLATLGMLILVCSYDLITMYLAIELQSLSLYIIATFKRNSEYSTEAGLKYFILGAFSSGLLLFGCSMLYGFTGITNFEEFTRLFTNITLFNNAPLISSINNVDSLNPMDEMFITSSGILIGLVFILSAFLFKMSAAPFHMWAPDVYEGSPTPVTAFFAITPKLAILGLFLRLCLFTFYDLIQPWQQMLMFCALASLLLATFAAFYQKRIKRLLVYSSIGHVGYLLIGFCTGTIEGVQSVMIYIIIYIIMTINMFTLVLSLRNQETLSRIKYISDLSFLAKMNPVIAITLTITLFSMAGIPPLAGFCSKLYIFFSAMDAGLYLLALVGVLMSVLSCFYYIRIIKIMYFDKMNQWIFFKTIDKNESIILGCTTFLILFIFFVPSPLLIYTHNLALVLCL